ncbi:MAG: single-stranded DNA-binding protein [Candidatus Thermochlorobacter sp.]
MSRGLNKVMLIGHLGADPEVRVLPSGISVANFSIATNEYYKDQNNELKERTEWHNIVAYGKLADVCRQYLKKGKQVYIEGRLQTRTWNDKDTGKKNYRTEIICSEMQMLGGRAEGGDISQEVSAEAPPEEITAPMPQVTSAETPQEEITAPTPPPNSPNSALNHTEITGEEKEDNLPF